MTLHIQLDVFDGTNRTRFEIRWEESSTTLTYLDSAGVRQPLATDVDLSHNAFLYHTLKLVVDGVDGEYHRLLFNERSFPVAGFGGEVTADASLPRREPSVLLGGRVGFNDRIHVDDVILTQNEPV